MHDGHLTTLKAPLEHVVLRWAKNITEIYIKQEAHDGPESLTWVSFPTKWILPSLLPLFQLMTPGMGSVLTPGVSYE